MSKNKAIRRSFWLIVTRSHGRMEVLTIDAGGETVLPLFSFQEEVELFLQLQAKGADWWPRETTTGELVSLLLGLCAPVDKVATRSFAESWEEGDYRARQHKSKTLSALPDG